ncbi:MAG: phage major capsid protein [Desulfitobacteriaceae bacterium]
MNLLELKQKYSGLCDQQKAIVDKAIAENRGMTGEENTEFDNLQKDIDGQAALIAKAETMEGRAAHLDAPAGNTMRPSGIPVVLGTQAAKKDDGGFKNLGELIYALRFGDAKGRTHELADNKNGQGGGKAVPEAFKAQIMPSFRNEWTMGTGSEGGIMVPAQRSTEVLRIQAEAAIVRPRARVIPAGDPPDSAITFPAFTQGSKGVYGGVEVHWTGEGQEMSETDGKLEEVTIQPKEVSALSVFTDRLLRNWEAADTFVSDLLNGAMSAAEDMAFLSGNGVAKPYGILNSPGTLFVNRSTANQINYIDTVNMLTKLLPESVSNALWIANQSTLPQLATMQDPEGHYIFIQGDATKGIPATLAGIPIKFTGKTSIIGKKSDLVLVDISYYLIKNGSGPFIAASEHVLFRNNKTIVRVVWNVDGQGWIKEPLVLEDKETKVSFAVVLDVPLV